MIGGQEKPFRQPAGGTIFFPGGFNKKCGCALFQHRHGDELAEKFNPTTTVPNPLVPDGSGKNPGDAGYVTTYKFGDTSGSPTTAPYERFNSGGGDCETYSCDGTAPCAPWIGTANFNAGDAQDYQYSLVVGQPNSLVQTGADDMATVNFALCHKSGDKTVASKLFWNGHPDFYDADYWDAYDTFEACNDNTGKAPGTAPNPAETVPGWQPTFDPQRAARSFGYQLNKFLNRAVTITFKVTGQLVSGGSTYIYTDTSTQSVAINAQSGERSVSGAMAPDLYGGSWSGAFTALAEWSIADIVAEFWNFSFPFTGSDDALHLTFSSDGVSGNSVVANSGWSDGSGIDYTGNTRESWTCNVAGQVFNRDKYGPTWPDSGTYPYGLGPPYIWKKYFHEDLSIAGNGYVLTQITTPISPPTMDFGGGPMFVTEIKVTVEVDYTSPSNAAAVYADGHALAGEWNLADKGYPWRTDNLPQVAPLMTRNQVSADTAGWQPLMVDDMRSPATDLNGFAPFTYDPINYSPNTSTPPPVGWTAGASGRGGDWTPTYTQMAWFDPNIYGWIYPTGKTSSNSAASSITKMFDGAVLGAPNPAGWQDYFCFQFVDVHACCDGNISFYTYGYGMKLSDYNLRVGAQLPRTATQWTNILQSVNKPPGASATYNDNHFVSNPDCGFPASPLGAKELWIYKHAKIIEPWPSQNFARPFGLDKFAYDETKVVWTDGTTLFHNDGTPLTVDPGVGTGIWGGKSVGGFFTGCSMNLSNGALTLGTKVFNLPSAWTSLSGDDTTCFGPLIYSAAPGMTFNDTASEVGGRVAITVTGGTAVAISDGLQPWLSQGTGGGETVNFYGAAWNLIAATTLARISDSSFTAGADVTGAVWMTPQFFFDGVTPWKYYMADEKPKGDFLTLEWLLDGMTNAEATRLARATHCDGSPVYFPPANNKYASFVQTQRKLPLTPFAPKVVCYSNNGEVFPNGVTIPFPATFLMDEKRSGSRWQSYVQDTMTDLFWQAPHKPYLISVGWAMDDGTCPGDGGTNYYPHAHQVEALAAEPSTYGAAGNETPPVPPAPIVIGWLSPVTNAPGPDVALPVLNVGYDAVSGLPLPFLSATTFYLMACAGGCRFDYSGDVIC